MKDELRKAYHESAHAVVGIALWGRVEHVTIVPDNTPREDGRMVRGHVIPTTPPWPTNALPFMDRPHYEFWREIVEPNPDHGLALWDRCAQIWCESAAISHASALVQARVLGPRGNITEGCGGDFESANRAEEVAARMRTVRRYRDPDARTTRAELDATRDYAMGLAAYTVIHHWLQIAITAMELMKRKTLTGNEATAMFYQLEQIREKLAVA